MLYHTCTCSKLPIISHAPSVVRVSIFASKLPHRVVLTATMPRKKRRAASSSTGSSDDERPKAMPRIRLPENIQCYNRYLHPLPKPPGYHGVRNMAAGRISVEDRLHDLVRFQHDNDEWNRAMADAGSGDSSLANMTTISLSLIHI